ncbi:MAG: alpha/beta fold hydrolase [Lysobacterales bacterium]|jgi:3-oxoadipate enol-lactonase
MPVFQHENHAIYWESLGQGEPVVFLNGVLMSVDSWKLQTLELGRRFRCVMHDFRGQLKSSKPDEPWTLEDHAKDLDALLDHLDIADCHIVGTSYGGEVGMIFAAARPERVRSLSVIASVSEIGPDTERIVLDWRRAALEAPESLYRVMLPTTFAPEFVAANPALVELGEERLQACEPEFFAAFAGLIDAFLELNITPMLGGIRCPTLVIAGEQDRLKPPRYSEIISDGIEGSELRVIPGAGHAVVLEQADWVNRELIRFIDQLYSRSI